MLSQQEHKQRFKACLHGWCVLPFKTLYNTLYRWWLPRICLLIYFIFCIVLSVGFKITIKQSVFDLNENISARNVLWHMQGMLASVFIAFYVHEWITECEWIAESETVRGLAQRDDRAPGRYMNSDGGLAETGRKDEDIILSDDG